MVGVSHLTNTCTPASFTPRQHHALHATTTLQTHLCITLLNTGRQAWCQRQQVTVKGSLGGASRWLSGSARENTAAAAAHEEHFDHHLP